MTPDGVLTVFRLKLKGFGFMPLAPWVVGATIDVATAVLPGELRADLVNLARKILQVRAHPSELSISNDLQSNSDCIRRVRAHRTLRCFGVTPTRMDAYPLRPRSRQAECHRCGASRTGDTTSVGR